SVTFARQGGAAAEDLFDFDTTTALFTVVGNELQAGGLTFATFTAGSGSLTIDFTGAGPGETTATTALVNDVMTHVAYFNNNDDPPASVVVGYTFDDGNTGAQGTGGHGIATNSTQVDITAVNDPPVNTVPGPQTADEDTDLSIQGLAVSDPDMGPVGPITVTLHVDHGTIHVRDDVLGGLDPLHITGNGSNTVVLERDPGVVNTTLTALNGVVYHGDLNYNGPDLLTITTNDNGHSGVDPSTLGFLDTGTPTTEEATSTVDITVNPVNDPPFDITGTLAVNEFATNGTSAGTVLAHDIDSTLFTYGLVDDAGGRFSIDNAGVVHVLDGLLLDFEQSTTHNITVRATDDGGASFDKTLAVTIDDVNPEFVVGDNTDNTFVGGPLNDILNGSRGNEQLTGGDGIDVLIGGPGNDTMTGGPGDDTYTVDQGNGLGLTGDQVIEGPNGGIDTVEQDVPVYFMPDNVENVVLNIGAVTLVGNGMDNTIGGNDLDNELGGGGGNDVVRGGNGNDLLFGGDGIDVLDGGAGGRQMVGRKGRYNQCVDQGN